MASLDSSLFDAYNGCALEKLGSFFSDDIEFYHDKGGLTESRKNVIETIKTNACGRVRRELVAGTLAVYPSLAMAPLKQALTASTTDKKEGPKRQSSFCVAEHRRRMEANPRD
ncbi:MAG: DUF4440 domain-containing protein [Gammaproteobacteria bacterium]